MSQEIKKVNETFKYSKLEKLTPAEIREGVKHLYQIPAVPMWPETLITSDEVAVIGGIPSDLSKEDVVVRTYEDEVAAAFENVIQVKPWKSMDGADLPTPSYLNAAYAATIYNEFVGLKGINKSNVDERIAIKENPSLSTKEKLSALAKIPQRTKNFGDLKSAARAYLAAMMCVLTGENGLSKPAKCYIADNEIAEMACKYLDIPVEEII